MSHSTESKLVKVEHTQEPNYNIWFHNDINHTLNKMACFRPTSTCPWGCLFRLFTKRPPLGVICWGQASNWNTSYALDPGAQHYRKTIRESSHPVCLEGGVYCLIPPSDSLQHLHFRAAVVCARVQVTAIQLGHWVQIGVHAEALGVAHACMRSPSARGTHLGVLVALHSRSTRFDGDHQTPLLGWDVHLTWYMDFVDWSVRSWKPAFDQGSHTLCPEGGGLDQLHMYIRSTVYRTTDAKNIALTERQKATIFCAGHWNVAQEKNTITNQRAVRVMGGEGTLNMVDSNRVRNMHTIHIQSYEICLLSPSLIQPFSHNSNT